MKKEKIIKKPYYVFLDIDGTLWDASYRARIYGPFANVVQDPSLNPESIKAINLLLRSLEEKFNTKLVITSSRRENMTECVRYLSFNDLNYNKPIFCTSFEPGIRGDKIVSYMQQQGEVGFKYPTLKNFISKILYSKKNEDFSNYVVLEDTRKKVRNQIPRSRIIYSNHNKQSITTDQVVDYLKANNLPVIEPGSLEDQLGLN